MFYIFSKLLWVVVAPSFFLPFLIIGALGWAVMRRSRRAAAIAAVAGAALSLATFTPIGLWSLASLEQRFPFNNSPAPPYGIAALGEDEDRVEALVMLSRQFPTARILYSGASNKEDFTKRYSMLGGDTSRLIIETASRNTEENARFSSEIVKPTSEQRWLLITSAFHMPRAIGCFRRAGFQVEAYPVSYLAKQEDASFGSKRLMMVDLAVHEWMGLIFYRLFHKTDTVFPSAIENKLASAETEIKPDATNS